MCLRDSCVTYYPNNTCQFCQDGYFVYNNICTNYNTFCIVGNINQGCTLCQNGYQIVNGLCNKLPDFCQILDAPMSCIRCLTGYSLFNKVCYRIIANCLFQTGNICIRCNQTYNLSSDKLSCIAIQPIKYCTLHDSTYDNCLVCADGYASTVDKKCLAQHCGQYNLQTYVCLSCTN